MSEKKSSSSISKKHFSSQYYTLPFDVTKRVELLLPYRCYVKQECKEKFLKQSKIRVHDRYKFFNKKLNMKLKKSEEALDQVRTVTDYDDVFLNIVNGRPLFHSIPRFKTLVNSFDNLFRTAQEIAYKKDSALNIDTNFRIENSIYDKTLRRFSEEAKAFDMFIMDGYKKSMRILEEEEKVSLKLEEKVSEMQSLADESFNIMSRLIGLDYKYGLQQKYGRFLYYVSPPMWRSSNREFARSVEIEAKGFDFGNSHDEDTFNTLFEKMRKECSVALTKPVLYFTHPRDLLHVFDGMEKQLLYHFSREAQVAPHIKAMKDAIRTLKLKIDKDSASVSTSIKDFENNVLQCEERCAELKDKFFKILHGFLYETVGTAEVLKLNFHLKFCYSKVFNETPMNMDMITLARAIESMYMDYSKQLDSIQSGAVRRAMIRCMELDNQKMDQAKKAAKELRLFNRLERELLRAHNLISEEKQMVNIQHKYVPVVPKRKIKRDVSKLHIHKRSYQSLNDAEIEYLSLFTDWTQNQDPSLYLQSINFDRDNKCNDPKD